MKTDLQQKWVKALRSGDYQQGDGHLKFTDQNGVTTFCCLGVLCDVMGAEWIYGMPMLGDVNMKKPENNHREDFEEYLSPVALESVGLSNLEQETLANMNDGGRSFDYIADYIEKEII